MYNSTVNRRYYTSTVRQRTLRQYTRKYRQKVKLFDNKSDFKLYKLIIIFYGESTVMQHFKGPKSDHFQ